MQFLDENHVVVALSSQRKFEGNGDPYNHLYIPARGAPLASVSREDTSVNFAWSNARGMGIWEKLFTR